MMFPLILSQIICWPLWIFSSIQDPSTYGLNAKNFRIEVKQPMQHVTSFCSVLLMTKPKNIASSLIRDKSSFSSSTGDPAHEQTLIV